MVKMIAADFPPMALFSFVTALRLLQNNLRPAPAVRPGR